MLSASSLEKGHLAPRPGGVEVVFGLVCVLRKSRLLWTGHALLFALQYLTVMFCMCFEAFVASFRTCRESSDCLG